MTSILAVVDTNVVVSAIMTRNPLSPTVQVINSIFNGLICPVVNCEIVSEYKDVLNHPRLNLKKELIEKYLTAIAQLGIYMEKTPYEGKMIDEKDRPFYEVSLTGDSYLVTGNLKHFPKTPRVISPTEMIAILEKM